MESGKQGDRLARLGEVSDRSNGSYYRLTFRAAWGEAWSFSKAQLVAAAVAGGLAYGIAVVVGSAPDAAPTLIFPLAALGLVWIGVFLYHLVSIPVKVTNRLVGERDEAVAELEAERSGVPPIEQLQLQLDRAMDVRGIVSRGVPQHWEGDVLVPDDPEDEVKLDNLVYAWFKATYGVIRKPPFTRHAEDFWGPAFRSLERSYLNTVYGGERDRLGGHDQLLHDRIELIKRILKEHGG